MRSNFFAPSWVSALSALDDCALVSVVRSLLQYYVSDSSESLFSSDSSLSGDAASCWENMVRDISEYVEKRNKLSAVRKAAGSLGGKKRAEKYHKPDGFSKPVPVDVSENRPQVNNDGAVQEPLYSKEDLVLSQKARVGAVRVLPSAIAGVGSAVNRQVVQVPVLMGNVVNGEVQLAQASGFGVQSVFQPVVVNYSSDADGGFNSWFMPEELKPGITPASSVSSKGVSSKKKVFKKQVNVSDGSDGKTVSETKSVKKKSSVRYSDPPKSPELIDTTPRRRYGEYENVLLTDKEFNTLKKEFPDTWESWIRRCDEYCERYRKEYKNYLMTIRAWARKDANKAKSSSMVDYSAGSSLGYVPSASVDVPFVDSVLPDGNPVADCLDPFNEFGFRDAKTQEELETCYARYAYKKMEDIPAGVHIDLCSPEFDAYYKKFYDEGVELHKKGLL